MQAIILAGGFGTRLQSVVSDVPKPMAPVCNRPFLTYLLDELDLQGFTKVVLAVGYKKEIIMDYFKNKYKSVEIVYSVEEKPLGTGGCVKLAMKYITDPFAFVLNGDTMFKVDYKCMAEQKDLSIACKKMYRFDRYGEVQIHQGIITAFQEKKFVEVGYINGGIYYLPRDIFDKYDLPERFSIEKDFFEAYIQKLSIKAYLSDDHFLDIGIPEDYAKAQVDFRNKKAVFLDRDGVINVDTGHVHRIDQFVFTDFIFDLCRKYQQAGYLLFVVTNQAGIGKGLYDEQDFFSLTEYMLYEMKTQGIEITKVYYCPHKPEDHCDCRKPMPGMFIKAIQDFGLNYEESIAIGDKLTDLEAAYAAGIRKLYYVSSKYETYDVPFDYEVLDV